MTLILLLTAGSGAALAFSDISPDRTDYRAITGLAVRKAVQGFSDGTFRPNSPVLRGEFVSMVAAALLPLRGASAAPFRDLNPDGPSGGLLGTYIGAAYLAGIVKGKSPTVFDPYAPLTRVQAMTIAVRAAQKLRARDFKPFPAGYQGKFVNFKDPVYGQNARLAEANHLLAGIDLRRWNPWAPATRSEAAVIVWNLVGCFG